MKTFKEFITEQETLNEKLIIIGKGKNYGQVVFVTGGGASGKGFAIQNFIDSNKFKIRDVDEYKTLFLKISNLKNKYPEIRNLSLKNPEDVFKLHTFVDQKDIKDKTLNKLLTNLEQDRLPNILFDITGKNEKSIYETATKLIEVGYNPKNINIIWVLANYEIAKKANKERDRFVPEDVLMSTHSGAAKTMAHLIFTNLNKTLINGSIYVILNNRDETKFYKGTNVIKDFTYLHFKKPGTDVNMTKEIKDKLKNWIDNNTPKEPELFKPKIAESENKFHQIDKIKLTPKLYAIVSDSDPYDAMTYFLNNKAIAMEYVPDYKKRIVDIKNDIDSFIKKLNNFK